MVVDQMVKRIKSIVSIEETYRKSYNEAVG